MKMCLLAMLLLSLRPSLSTGQIGHKYHKINQPHLTVKQIGIGDRMPDIVISNMINYPSTSLRLSDLRGKYIILDFWHTRCSSCINAFPKMQKLQDRFAKQLKVILVSYESRDIINKFLLIHKQVTGLNVKLPIACNDFKLNGYFNPPSYPHYIWIDQKGIVRYISFGSDITEQNLEAVLNKKPVQIDEKNDTTLTFDPNKPLFVNNNGGDGNHIICYSLLSKYVPNMATVSGYNHPGDSNSCIRAYSWPIKGLFQVAFNDYLNNYHLPDNRTILLVKDTMRYVWNKNSAVQWNNLYEYQLFAPYRSVDSLKKMMQQDLMRYFGLEAHMEKKIMKCWVLTAEDTTLLISKGGWPDNSIYAQDFSMIIRNVADSAIALRFIYNVFYSSPFPFINEIHMKNHADVLLDKVNFDDPEAVIQAIKKYKLNIRLEDHPVDILVITEPGYKTEFGVSKNE
jgi:thiol-disulfide isomerase/thioredoxin